MGGFVALSAPEYVHCTWIDHRPGAARFQTYSHMYTWGSSNKSISKSQQYSTVLLRASVHGRDNSPPPPSVKESRSFAVPTYIQGPPYPCPAATVATDPWLVPQGSIQQRKGNGVISRCDSQSLVLPLSSLKSLSSRQMRLLASVRTIDSYIVFLSQLLPTTSITRSRHPSCAASW